MKTTYHIIINLILSVFACNNLIYAQSERELTETAKMRAQQEVGQLLDYIDFIARKDFSLQEKKSYKKEALNLFVGKGYEYEEDGMTKRGVRMQTKSLYRKTTTSKLMRDYFDGLMNLRYAKVVIESTEITQIKVSELRKTGEGEYVCTCYFDQAFAGYTKEGNPIYKDLTRKRVKCYISMVEIDGTIELIIRLGDVSVDSIKRL